MQDTNKEFEFTIDGQAVSAKAGQTVLEAADAAGIYIPRLCYMKGLIPHGSCRICLVKIGGRMQAACTQPAEAGAVVENDTPELMEIRRSMLDMLFVEGNHYCPFCEKSGNCELQALAYRFGVTVPQYPYLFPERDVDASHPEVLIDHNRCILCGRCVAASKDLDGKNVFQFVERSHEKKLAVNADAQLKDTDLDGADKAVDVCPVGAILRKRVGFAVPIGSRKYDSEPIGSELDNRERQGEE